MEPSRGVPLGLVAVGGFVVAGAALAAIDNRVAAVVVAATVIAGWIWSPISGARWERFGAVLVLQMAVLIPVGFVARWLSWSLTWALIVVLLGSVVAVGVYRRRAHGELGRPARNPLDCSRTTSVMQFGVVALPTLVVALPYLTRNTGGHLWLFSRGFDNSAHFNVMSAIAKTGAWPWGDRFADVSGQAISSPALAPQVWATIARALALGGLPSGDVLVLAFALGQILAYAFLCYGVVLLFRQVASQPELASVSRWVWVFVLTTLIVLLSVGSSITLVLNGFATYAWAIAGLAFCLAGAMSLPQRNLPLSLTLVLAGGVVATMSYAPLVITSLVIALMAAWYLRSISSARAGLSGLVIAIAITLSALMIGLLGLSLVRSLLAGVSEIQILPAIYFFPLEALAVSGGIEAIPWFAMLASLGGAVVYLVLVLRYRPTFPAKVALVTLAVAALVAAVVGVYSLAQVGQISYYTIKLQYALLVLSLPFFVGALVLLLSKWQRRPVLGAAVAIAILLVISQSFGYSLPFGQSAFLSTGLPPKYISPGLAWLQLTNNPNDYPGFPGEAVADLGTRPADGVVVLWNPPDVDSTQERGLQIYPNSMRYTGDTWVWSLANTLLGTDWGDEALEQLWNWRWSNQRGAVTIYTFSASDFEKVTERLPEFISPDETSGLYPCTLDRTCVTEVVLVTLGSES